LLDDIDRASKCQHTAPKDETYVIDRCDEVLGFKSLRGHRFSFLKGDEGKTGTLAALPVDAYCPDLNAVIEYHERQHSEPISHFDRRVVIGGISRGRQRMIYDRRGAWVLPLCQVDLIILRYKEFEHTGAKRLKRVAGDRDIIVYCFATVTIRASTFAR
jgi:hypothetical protein